MNFDFISEYENKLVKLTDNITSSGLKVIEASLERAKQIERQLALPNYRLVFIGEPGSGKTTTICNYLNLTKDVEEGDRLEGRFELLETAAGRTTAAEVHVMKAEQTALIVHPMERSAQEVLIKMYCAYIWSAAHPGKDGTEESEADGSGEVKDPILEYEDIIKAMLGYESDEDEDFMAFVKQAYAESTEEIFIADMLDKIALDARTHTEFSYAASASEDAKTWLQKTFRAINNGQMADVCIPERIDVLLYPDDLDFYIPEWISEVIDTRGFDGKEVREDLRDYMDAEDTICVILDKVESMPGELQRKILSQWVDKEQTDKKHRISLLIKDKNDALAEVNGADGDTECGEKLKLDELRRSIASNALNYCEENTLFVDSYEGIDISKKKQANNKTLKIVRELDEDARLALRDRITAHFSGMIARHHDALTKEAETLRTTIANMYTIIATPSKSRVFADKLKEISDMNNKASEAMLEKISSWLKSYGYEKDFLYGDFYSGRNRNNRRLHWKSAMATTRLDGTWRNANIYAEYKEYCENIVKKFCYPRMWEIIDSLELLEDCEASEEEIEALMDSCSTTVYIAYSKMVNTIKEAAPKLCREALPKDFWFKARFVERGSGYVNRLMDAIYNQMRNSRLCEHTTEVMQDAIRHFAGEISQALTAESSGTEA